MDILDIDIVKGFMRMCNDGWLQAGTSATAAT